tara:strand:- start:5 stop:586 length:582 start_codon:yes stop_codon:yes gene_type:complete
MTNNITPIFATGISVCNLENINNSEIVEYVKNQNDEHKDIYNIISNPIFKNINNIIEQKMNEHYHEIYNKKFNIKLAQGWGNFGDNGIITMPHAHTTSFLSAVYYPYAEEGFLTFINPMTGLLAGQSREMIDNHNIYSSEIYSQPSITGSLIIFNSMLMHLLKCEKNTERVSLAYNATLDVNKKIRKNNEFIS